MVWYSIYKSRDNEVPLDKMNRFYYPIFLSSFCSCIIIFGGGDGDSSYAPIPTYCVRFFLTTSKYAHSWTHFKIVHNWWALIPLFLFRVCVCALFFWACKHDLIHPDVFFLVFAQTVFRHAKLLLWFVVSIRESEYLSFVLAWEDFHRIEQFNCTR